MPPSVRPVPARKEDGNQVESVNEEWKFFYTGLKLERLLPVELRTFLPEVMTFVPKYVYCGAK